MFGIGSTELLIIVVVALIVIGPKKLPDMMRTLGKGLAEFKHMGADVKRTLDREIEQAEQDIRTADVKEKLYKEDKAEDASPEQEGESEKAESSDTPESNESSAANEAEPTVGKESA